MDYRQLPRYANSDLGEYRNSLFSFSARKPSQAALLFGTMFHSLILECNAPEEVSPATAKQLGAMRESILKNRFARQVLLRAEVEQVRTWTDPQTGLPCKSKIDILNEQEGLIVDLKTTRTKTYGEFLKSCVEYDYDRQGAYYLDGVEGAERFVILGVQKQPPFGVFYFEATSARGCIELGRKKYRALLGGIARSEFIPSSWQRPIELITA